MTREEHKKAIEVLDDMKVKIDIPKAAKTQNDRNWALDVAIQALSQEPTYYPPCIDCNKKMDEIRRAYDKLKEQEPCDAISREAVLSKIKEVCFSKEWTQFRVDNGSNGQRDFIIDYIEQLPSATQKYGRWITTRTFMHDGEYYCDRCKCDAPNNEKWDYCPNCGCRMVEPQEQERSDKE